MFKYTKKDIYGMDNYDKPEKKPTTYTFRYYLINDKNDKRRFAYVGMVFDSNGNSGTRHVSKQWTTFMGANVEGMDKARDLTYAIPGLIVEQIPLIKEYRGGDILFQV